MNDEAGVVIDPSPSGSIHLFFATPISVGHDKRYEDAVAILSADEVERAERFRFDADRIRFVTGRALVRRSLSRFADVRPADWRFESNSYGRPLIARPSEFQQLRFSASRTVGLAMCAVTRGREIGADVERLRDYPAEIVERYFSRNEARFVRQSAYEERPFLFFANWTLKEAYCKAKGLGLSIPIAKVQFSLADEQPSMTIEPPLEDDSAHWKFRLLSPRPEYVAALCVDVRQQPMPNIEVDDSLIL